MASTLTSLDYANAWGISRTKTTQAKDPFWRKAAKLAIYTPAGYAEQLRLAIDEELADHRRLVESATEVAVEAQFERLAADRRLAESRQ